jgi:taurine transport system substrate-binding protein
MNHTLSFLRRALHAAAFVVASAAIVSPAHAETREVVIG